MKCPHCEYGAKIERFFSLEMPLRRTYISDEGYTKRNKTYLLACPKCIKTFIDYRE